MRARHRHFNPKAAGAAVVLDSRYISGLSNGNEVSTWPDRSGNSRDVTQATSANRPTYQNAVQGGQPVVRFDGSNDRLASASFATASSASAVMVAKSDGWRAGSNYRPIAGHGYDAVSNSTEGILLGAGAGGTFADWTQYDYLNFGNGFTSGRAPRAIGPASGGTDWRILSSILGPNTARMDANGTRATTRVETTGNCGSVTKPFYVAVGLPTNNEFWDGDIASISYFQSELATPLKRRLEHAAAFSFKISCN